MATAFVTAAQSKSFSDFKVSPAQSPFTWSVLTGEPVKKPRNLCVMAAKLKDAKLTVKRNEDSKGKKAKTLADIYIKRVLPSSWAPLWGWDGSADEDMGALESWLRSEGMPPQAVTLNPVQEGERGLFAKEEIGKGEALLFIPEKMLILSETVYGCPQIGKLLKELNVPEWPAFAVFLLAEGSKGKNSKWNVYLEALPQNPGCILMWPLEEVDRLLEGSPVKDKAIQCIAEVTDTFNDLNSALFSKHPEIFPPELFTLGAFKWAFSIVFSRLVRLPSKNDQLALVPWGDMVNHRSDVSVYLDYDQFSKSVVLKTDRKYNPGDQVYVSYGPKSNGELLVAYGMVPAGRNPHNSVDFQLGLSSDDPIFEKKLQILKQNGLTSPMKFPAKMEGLPAQLIYYARLAVADPSTSDETLQELAKAASTKEGQPLALLPKLIPQPSLEEERNLREFILAACQVALSAYSTSLEDDENVMASLLESGVGTFSEDAIQERVYAAVALRVGEKKILYKTDAVVRSELKEINRIESRGEGRTAVALGNNFQGRSGGFVDAILKRIATPW